MSEILLVCSVSRGNSIAFSSAVSAGKLLANLVSLKPLLGSLLPQIGVAHIGKSQCRRWGHPVTKIEWMADFDPKHRLEGTCLRYQRKWQIYTRENGVGYALTFEAGRVL